MRYLTMIALLLIYTNTQAQEIPGKEKKWYDNIHLGGYFQVRYNNLFETNPDLECEQCDEFWGADGGGFSLRRMRFKITGQIGERVFMYFQPDFAKSVDGSIHVARIKDAYMDIGLDDRNEYRVRIGQSKVPFGYENMQSSSDRLPLDRNDAINSGVKDERDMGVFLYWAPERIRHLMKELKPYKHSGDFGVFGLGIYNGQTANHPDENSVFHVAARFSYPIKLKKNQIIEPGIQAYSGKYVLPEVSPEVHTNAAMEYLDQRIAASFILYPRPFGIQAEYNIGKGPEFDKSTLSVKEKSLHGGYATLSYFVQRGHQQIIPFVRLQSYNGGKKHELDARSYEVMESEAGIEYHPFKHFELVAVYTVSDRRYEDYIKQNNHQTGSVVRIQAQLRF
ncbi:porin [Sinomicrobium weinanense]|uniref:Porin n=1 Tax=Sinomicrobium weinanense TaxID=2842200 RepID=A0A926PZZ9_9FLAO|nr:porin [Sinomicrobium weinanense]MBC9794453.1 porin [Sinomicrobium weinanense]MBU3124360.1 OprO/OprP family phosphate-selective porin [Sinomicrobium weinanense]